MKFKLLWETMLDFSDLNVQLTLSGEKVNMSTASYQAKILPFKK